MAYDEFHPPKVLPYQNAQLDTTLSCDMPQDEQQRRLMDIVDINGEEIEAPPQIDLGLDFGSGVLPFNRAVKTDYDDRGRF